MNILKIGSMNATVPLSNDACAPKQGRGSHIEFAVDSQLINVNTQQKLTSIEKSLAPTQTPTDLNPRFLFENFVVGTSNRFAFAAAQAVAENPAKAYNPFFIYGPVGLGKTHLLQAITHEAKRKNPALKICYLSSEQFTNELINSIRHRSAENFPSKIPARRHPLDR